MATEAEWRIVRERGIASSFEDSYPAARFLLERTFSVWIVNERSIEGQKAAERVLSRRPEITQ
jgi:hypothetical protein